ncbi:HumD family translesion DNA polymerase [Citrobacter amalonaticus]|uniref:HumD family translesion DNA polymerase n=1 Tax=Citrobacter amalonaticus TaxID=35703 RepID=UPI001C7E1257|nr:S24 family peptidase [Citrobacter amalonaticus]MDS4039399.1 S24 family peptidase [Citrobacter amalonaticus]QZA37479.1 LexA family transcriptional regulator [Citrobacter amalonaticus]HED3078815.1 LexA family transcriptional regulator [Citrobacter amalonaticus]HED3671575.1 LexA family transcriptional regulator [Citrobacter amalonaticus]HED3697615.1 LexA family transcriptional regulator [Citrobacter amalonaticus]
MGFHIQASDYAVERLSLDSKLIPRPTSTYIMQSAETIWRVGIMKDAMLVVDSAATPVDGSIIVCQLNDELRLKRLRFSPVRCLEDLNYPDRHQMLISETLIMGVVTYIINDARSAELDDCPVI